MASEVEANDGAEGDQVVVSRNRRRLRSIPYDDDYPSLVADTMDFLYGSGVAAKLMTAPRVVRAVLGGGR